MMRYLADEFIVQWPTLQKKYPNAQYWKFVMIFCTVGNDHRRFIRFEKVVRKLAASHQLVFQHGHSNPVFHETSQMWIS